MSNFVCSLTIFIMALLINSLNQRYPQKCVDELLKGMPMGQAEEAPKSGAGHAIPNAPSWSKRSWLYW